MKELLSLLGSIAPAQAQTEGLHTPAKATSRGAKQVSSTVPGVPAKAAMQVLTDSVVVAATGVLSLSATQCPF